MGRSLPPQPEPMPWTRAARSSLLSLYHYSTSHWTRASSRLVSFVASPYFIYLLNKCVCCTLCTRVLHTSLCSLNYRGNITIVARLLLLLLLWPAGRLLPPRLKLPECRASVCARVSWPTPYVHCTRYIRYIRWFDSPNVRFLLPSVKTNDSGGSLGKPCRSSKPKNRV